MVKIVVLSDTHIKPEGKMVCGMDPLQRMREAVDHINANHADADRVVILGDLVHRGDEASYRRFVSVAETLVVPMALMLGNHDDRATFLSVFGDQWADAHGFVQHVADLPGCRLVCLDSLSDDGKSWGHLCAQRLAFLEAALAGAADRKVLVFLHHPPAQTGFHYMDSIRLQNADELMDTIKRSGADCHLFSGHVHRAVSGTLSGIPFNIMPTTADKMPMQLEPTDGDVSVAGPGSYGIILVRAGTVVVHTVDFTLGGAA